MAGIVNSITTKEASVQSHTFKSLNHLFQPAKTGSVDEYKDIEQTIDEQVLPTISIWLARNFNQNRINANHTKVLR